MARWLIAAALLGLATPAMATERTEEARWRAHAAAVEIVRDDWGIAHIHGRTDADAVFGMIYAQAEDDFPRIERNYLVALGRLAEAEGEGALWQDLRQRLYLDEETLRAAHARTAPWLHALTTAWADGLNFYLARHPEVRPKVLARFEPWMALAFSEGSIGGHIERISLSGLQSFYGGVPVAASAAERGLMPTEPSGSNGIAIAPRLTRDGHAMLLINPHTSFYFRAEQQVRSDEGLNAYGAATWGQFFIYQGFNPRLGWMHTSSNVDNVDAFVETIVRRGGQLFYRYGKEERPVTSRAVTLRYRQPDGTMAERRITTYATHHGPIVGAEGERWLAMALMNRPVPALEQSYLRTKATSFADYLDVAERQANDSNNTLYADADGTVAFLMPQFVPRRDDRFDYTGTIDGSDPATDWQGLHALSELPQVVRPAGGWAANTNNWPYSAAGADSPKQAAYPRYMDQGGENTRGLHAAALLASVRGLTLEDLNALAYDPGLPAFDRVLPALFAAFDRLPAADPRRAALAGPVAALRAWDRRWGVDSIGTTLASLWAERMIVRVDPKAAPTQLARFDGIAGLTDDEAKLAGLTEVVDKLQRDWGRWQVRWGEINRFQRRAGAIDAGFDDNEPSLPVPFASGLWGSLASFGAPPVAGLAKRYGTSGNSFVAVVEFGDQPRALAVSAGGESGDPASPHFRDQAARYASGALRPVYLNERDLQGHVERRYRPGGRVR